MYSFTLMYIFMVDDIQWHINIFWGLVPFFFLKKKSIGPNLGISLIVGSKNRSWWGYSGAQEPKGLITVG